MYIWTLFCLEKVKIADNYFSSPWLLYFQFQLYSTDKVTKYTSKLLLVVTTQTHKSNDHNIQIAILVFCSFL